MTSPAVMLSGLVPGTIVGGATGWTLKIGKLITSPDKLIVFYDTGGNPPNPRWLVDFSHVMVHVRSSANDYGTAYAKMRDIRDCLLGLDSQDVGSDRLVSVTCLGDIAFLSYDDKERPLFSLNFRLIIEPPTSSLTKREAL